MPISLLPGVTADGALKALRHEAHEAATMRDSSGTAFDRSAAYNEWAQQAIGRLSYVLAPTEVDRLVMSQRHWLLQGLDPATRGNTLASLVDLETRLVANRLDQAAGEMERDVLRWRRPGWVVVPDTNVYMHHTTPFDETDWYMTVGVEETIRIVMPLVIVDELDRQAHQGRPGDAGCRTSLRTIDQMLGDPTEPAKVRPDRSRGFLFELLLDPVGHVRLPVADDEIVDRVAALTPLNSLPAADARHLRQGHGPPSLGRGCALTFLLTHEPAG